MAFDSAPVQDSTNPVTSGGVYLAIAAATGAATVDAVPTEGSANPVSSGGVYDALQDVQPSITMDAAPTEGSTNPVESGGIYTAIHTLRASTEKASVSLTVEWEGEGPYTQAVTIEGATAATKVDLQPDEEAIAQLISDGVKALWVENDGGVLTAVAYGAAPTAAMSIQCTLQSIEGQDAYDTAPTEGSTALVLSGGVWSALQDKQDVLTFDDEPTEGGANPMTSGAIYAALARVEGGIVDTDPAEGSANAVSSGGVYAALAGKQDTLAFDDAPTEGSANPVTSDGIYLAIAGKQDVLAFDTSPAYGSTNPVTSGAVYGALALKQGILSFDTEPTQGSNGVLTSGAVYNALQDVPSSLVFDDEPTEGSDNPVKSGGIYAALQDVQPSMNMDATPTEGSTNAVTSGGVYSAIEAAAQVDAIPTSGSDNAVSSGGVYAALLTKQERAWTGSITLPASGWAGNGPYTHAVSLSGATEHSVVSLLPGHALIEQFRQQGIESLWIENDGGTLTAYLIGTPPSSALAVPCMVMDVGDGPSAGGGVSTAVDGELDADSENPVQNRAVYAAMALKEDAANRVDQITESSTDSQYPTAKAVWDLFNSIINGDEVGF